MIRRTISLLVAALSLAACSNSTVNKDWHRSRPVAEGRRPIGLPGQPVEPGFRPGERAGATAASAARDPRSMVTIDGSSHATMGWSELISRAAQSDIVLIGEVHGHPGAQAFLAAFWDDLTPQAGGAWLALEFFDRDQQNALDDYLAGVTTEDEFKKNAARNNSNYPPGHRAMVERAKALGRPVIAANSPRRYARLARTSGYDKLQALGPETQRLFVVPSTMTEGRYRTEFENMMRDSLRQGAHDAAEKKEKAEAAKQGDTTPEPEDIEAKVQGYYRSQNLWDATMADSITRPALAGARPVVLVVGQYHTDFNGGLVERIRAAAPNLRVMTISLADEFASQGNALRPADAGRADAVIYLK
ncbi:MAG: ChaN family lipoprotein [Phycisphaerae bacterium]|nr:ChaN family lipoprotein [Phycisphaerae bacterium]